jgi:hypothetical protein
MQADAAESRLGHEYIHLWSIEPVFIALENRFVPF